LRAASSDNLELGFKSLLGQATRLDMALFAVDTEREIVVDTNSGGRTTYRNAGRTRRTGVETSLQTGWSNGLELAAAYTFLTARYRDSIAGSPILADNFIPGIPRRSLYIEGLWRHAPSGFMAAIELRDVGKVWVNDANADAAEAYTTIGFRFGFEQRASDWTLKEFLRVDDLGDRRYAGSVIVNEANQRFFEPAPGRGVLVGISAQYGF
jgi:iron complex outermembrane receptor protein